MVTLFSQSSFQVSLDSTDMNRGEMELVTESRGFRREQGKQALSPPNT